MKAPREFCRNLTGREAEGAFGVYAEQLYRWVAEGRLHPVKERNYGWTVYPEWEIEQLAASLDTRRIAGGAPEGEIREMAASFDRATDYGAELRDRIRVLLHELRESESLEDLPRLKRLGGELQALLARPTNGGETISSDRPLAYRRAEKAAA